MPSISKSNLAWILFRTTLFICAAYCVFCEWSELSTWHPSIATFAPKYTVSGAFRYDDFGKSLQHSWIDGHSVAMAVSYAGGHRGFGRGTGIQNGEVVTAEVAEIPTHAGTVWIAERIENATRTFYSRTPQELYDAWISESYRLLAFHCALIAVGFFLAYAVAAAAIKSVLSRRAES